VENVSTSGALEPKSLPDGTISAQNSPLEVSKWLILRRNCAGIVDYLLDSEVHTFAFSVAANAILSFIPFVILLYTIAKSVFHSHAMADVIGDAVLAYFPSTASSKFWDVFETVVPSHVKLLSLVMILISCTGIFLPLEVALNKAWGVTKSRNYIMNQVVSFGLAILMVVLGMGSIMLSTGQRQVLTFVMFKHTDNWFYQGISSIWMLLCTGVACILLFFAVYWVLPNCKVPWRPVLRTSVVTGVVWLVAKYIFTEALPHLDLKSLYGPFYVSVGLLFWAYISGLILFAGAQFSAHPRPEQTKT
jgi:YihY family inner membrane protein